MRFCCCLSNQPKRESTFWLPYHSNRMYMWWWFFSIIHEPFLCVLYRCLHPTFLLMSCFSFIRFLLGGWTILFTLVVLQNIAEIAVCRCHKRAWRCDMNRKLIIPYQIKNDLVRKTVQRHRMNVCVCVCVCVCSHFIVSYGSLENERQFFKQFWHVSHSPNTRQWIKNGQSSFSTEICQQMLICVY